MKLIAFTLTIIVMIICETKLIIENVLFRFRLKNPPQKLYNQYYSNDRGQIFSWWSTDVSGKNKIDIDTVYKLFGAYKYKSKAEGYYILSAKRIGKWKNM